MPRTFFFAVGELLISALGMSMAAKRFPVRIRAFCFGTWVTSFPSTELRSQSEYHGPGA